MSKNSEIQQYISASKNQTPGSLNQLNQQGMVIFGDFSNIRIFTESVTKMPKEGILILESHDLVFYGSKSMIEKEYILFMPYENIKIASSPAFTINFVVYEPFGKPDKCKFSIAWEDYISKNTKAVFLEKLNLLITSSLINRVRSAAKEKARSEEAYIYYNRMFNEKIFDREFLLYFVELAKTEAKIESHGYSNLYSKFLNGKKETLLAAYDFPEARKIIEDELSENRTSLLTETSAEFFHNFYHDYIYFDDDKKISTDEAARHPGIRKVIEEETAKEVALLREKIQAEYQEKSDQLINKLEIEKNIYREVIRDNILLAGNLKIDQFVSEKLIDAVTNFYYRYKVLKDKFPDQFTIDRARPHEGLTSFRFILDHLSADYLKICDPYLFASEIELLFDVPEDLDVKILTFAVYQNPEKLEKFKAKIEEFRKSRFGRVAVKLVFFKNRTNSPLHDRMIFSKDWGLNLSNSLSQIGATHDVSCSRIYNNRDQEVSHFDDYWFSHNELTVQGKKFNVTVIDL